MTSRPLVTRLCNARARGAPADLAVGELESKNPTVAGRRPGFDMAIFAPNLLGEMGVMT
jgi:hypothetical protein